MPTIAVDNMFKNLLEAFKKKFLCCHEMSPGVWEYAEDGEYSISLEVPYGIEDFETFYEAGIRAILKEKFGEDNYTIIV